MIRTLFERFGRGTVIFVVAAVAVAFAGATAAYLVLTGGDEYRISARFTATPGLYPDNNVDILGVPTGRVVSVTPHEEYVDVVMSLPADVRVPANARAVLMAPNPVSDRFVELTPAYTAEGASARMLRDGAVIPNSRTAVPLELDQIYASVSDLSRTLGPSGANEHGELSAVLHAFAHLANGNGAAVHTAIEKISAALPALTAHPRQLADLISGLDRITSTLAAHDATINKLYSDLATATTQISDERQTLSAAIANLQRGLVAVTTYLRENRAHIRGSVQHLDDTVAAIMSEQSSLIKTFDTAPLGFQNFNRTIQANGPCISATGAPDNCTELWGRLDLPSDAWAFVQNYCGNSVLYAMTPIVESNAGLAKPSAADTACGAQVGLLAKRNGAPGAPKTPDLDLSHYLGSR